MLGILKTKLAQAAATGSVPATVFLILAITAVPGIAQGVNPIVVVDTTHGKFKLELFAGKAPVTVRNFLRYVDNKFYDGLIFHRVIDNFMIQGGGHTADMKEKKATHKPIINEASNGLSNARGTIAVARMVQPNSGTTQFFINVKDNAYLDQARAADKQGYAVFGKVIDGMDVVDTIKKVPTGNRGALQNVPLEPVVIRSMRRASEFALAIAGSLRAGKTFTITAHLEFPGSGQALTLELPPGVERIEGKEMQPVAVGDGPGLVLWKARALKAGSYDIRVRSTAGAVQSRTIQVRMP
ncbi:MAG: peptidyl-prolyl cis-trans isomerase [Planctomycetes bacterium]|nr:peptidyl-prolyl cis-trans isomerase [Planctomycetota bacterium]